MSSHRAPDIDRRAAEHLLAGRPAGHATRPLAAALRAAAAPAHPDELSGERAAMAAFAAAHLDPVPEPRRPSMLKSTLAKILTVKAAVILAAAAGTGGVVLASTSGVLPAPWTDSPADPPAVTTPLWVAAEGRCEVGPLNDVVIWRVDDREGRARLKRHDTVQAPIVQQPFRGAGIRHDVR